MKSATRALDLLETVVASPHPLTLKEIAAIRRLPLSTTSRFLAFLAARGYVTRHAVTLRYRGGLRLWELGCAAVDRQEIAPDARPLLEALVDKTGETATLATYRSGEIVYLDRVNGHQPIGLVLRVGERAPAHCTAVGKAILAWSAPAEVSRLFRRGVARFTSATITAEREFLGELERVRARGYAVNRGEYRHSVSGVAAPVFDHEGEVVFALGTAGPSERLGDRRMAMTGALLKRAARQLSMSVYGAAASVRARRRTPPGEGESPGRSRPPVRAPRRRSHSARP